MYANRSGNYITGTLANLSALCEVTKEGVDAFLGSLNVTLQRLFVETQPRGEGGQNAKTTTTFHGTGLL